MSLASCSCLSFSLDVLVFSVLALIMIISFNFV